jgi:hypothetical protein
MGMLAMPPVLTKMNTIGFSANLSSEEEAPEKASRGKFKNDRELKKLSFATTTIQSSGLASPFGGWPSEVWLGGRVKRRLIHKGRAGVRWNASSGAAVSVGSQPYHCHSGANLSQSRGKMLGGRYHTTRQVVETTSMPFAATSIVLYGELTACMLPCTIHGPSNSAP